MIFKVILQNLQTSNTSASQKNSREITSENIQNLQAREKFVGVGFSKAKTRDTDVILSPSFPQYLMLLLLLSEVWNYIPQADTLL